MHWLAPQAKDTVLRSRTSLILRKSRGSRSLGAMCIKNCLRLFVAMGLVTSLAACLSETRQTGWAAGYGRSYEKPIAVRMPRNAYSISQQFRRAELHHGAHHVADHFGIDVHAPVGTSVLAAAEGRVISSYWEPGYGHRIEIDHGSDGTGKVAQTNYVHLQKRLVHKGDYVQQGQHIATLGATGLTAGGFPHLHFEVLYGGPSVRHHAQDPHLFWADGVGRVTCFGTQRSGRNGSTFKITYPVACK